MLQKKIIIRPPEYWPDLASVALMQAADIIILADTFQYSRQSMQNRMRVRNPSGWQWVSVPLRGGQHGFPQSVTRIRPVPGWRKRHWKAILFNYSQTPYFDHYRESIKDLYLRKWDCLSDLNIATSRMVYKWLGGEGSLLSATELEGSPDSVEAIMKLWPHADLLAPVGIPEPLMAQQFHFSPPCYRQAFSGFVSGMTSLDLIFNYGLESANLLRAGARIVSAEHQNIID